MAETGREFAESLLTTIRGGCLCGGVRFELAGAVGPFELCHCRRCRKASGAAFSAALGVRTADFRLLQGHDLIATYDAPILRRPPAYRTSFCRRCGSPVPNPDPGAEWFEVPAGALDDDPQRRPDKHIFIELKAPWFEITDALPQYDQLALRQLRQKVGRVGSLPLSEGPMITNITHTSIYVPDQDEAASWYREKLGFVVREDDAHTIPGFRWLAISPEGNDSVKLAIFKATAEEQRKKIGTNTICVLATADCRDTVRTLESRGVKILTQPEDFPWGVSAVFADLYGNLYNLVERRR